MNGDELPPEHSAANPNPAAAPRALHAATDAKGDTEVVFQSLDPRVISFWRLQSLISWSILIVLAAAAGAVFTFNFRGLWIWVLALLGGLAVLALLSIFWLPPRSYRAAGYRIDERVLEERQGIWFQVVTLLPLSRLQHVDLRRGPLERLFGLASLHLHTAGTEHSSITIEGLAEADALKLRDHLVAVGAGGDDAV